MSGQATSRIRVRLVRSQHRWVLVVLMVLLLIEVGLGTVARYTGNEWQQAPLCTSPQSGDHGTCVTEKAGTIDVGYYSCSGGAYYYGCSPLAIDITFVDGSKRHFSDVLYDKITAFLAGGSRDPSVLPQYSGPVVGRFYSDRLVGLRFPNGASFATDDYPNYNLNSAATQLLYFLPVVVLFTVFGVAILRDVRHSRQKRRESL